MSNNTNQQTNNKQKKGVSFLSLLIAILIILAVIAGVYFALFPDKADIPFVSEEIENKINAFIKKPDNASETNSAQNDTENKGLLNSLQNSANEIFEKLSPEQPAKISPDQNAENNLAEHDMTPLVQQNNTFQENNAEEKTPEDFALEPPSTITPLESGRKMLTEEEIALAQEKDKQEKLAKLEELRSNQLAPSAQDTAFPSKQGTLTSLVPDTSFDPVVSLFFIQDLADYLVNNYKTDADGQAVLTTSMPRINQRYGTGLMGLEHMKGRAGVLEYAYNANMLPVLYEHLSPALIRSMRQIAKQKNMPDAEQEKMFNAYAKQCTVYARGIRILQDIPQLSENIQNLLAIENDLAQEERFFAETMLGFEQNRDNKDLARTFEENIKQSSIRSEQLRSRVSKVKNDLKQYLVSHDENLASVPHLLELALWLNRRNNTPANLAFADALEQFAHDLSTISYE